MKPLHVGLLVVGAALAGGLAVTMTQAPVVTQAPPVPVATPVVTPAAQPGTPAVSHFAVSPPVVKPSPIPVSPQRVTPPTRASAPQPVYDEPAKPAIRKYKPILMANAKPTQWTPGPYQSPPGAVLAKPRPAVAEHPVEHDAATEPGPAFTPRHVTLQTGIAIPIRLDESLSSDKSLAGDTFQASLAESFVVDGLVIAERGARVTGRIVNAEKTRLELGLATLTTSDGQRVAISTDPWTKEIGSGDGLGAGTVIRFRLASRVTITEQQIAGK
jgi:hypothetical protein